MIERLQMFACGACAQRVVVLRGGAGELSCCDRAMMLHQENPQEAAERRRAAIEGALGGKIGICACETCGSMVVVLRRGAGLPACCSRAMQVVKEDALDETQADRTAAKPPTMEHNLSMPVKAVLRIMQDRQPITTYFGINTQKSPLDFWVYQEILYELKPDVVIEIGNAYGGSTLALAHLFDHMGKGRLLAVDVQHETIAPLARQHPRITLITGDACASFPAVREQIAATDTVLVIEDSSHTYENTLNVLRAFCPLVTVGSYLIVEDSNCHHGVDIGPFPGPYEAILDFLKENPDFEADRSRESFFITWNPMGYIRRTR